VNAILPYLRKFPLVQADTDRFNEELKATRDALRHHDRAFTTLAPGRIDSRWEPTSLSEIVRKLQVSDWIFDFVVLLIASVLGISLLWLTDATWGGVEDYIPAFLWGLGLHVVSGSLFQGLPGLRQRLVG
jgi:hypothetical protein